MKLQNKEPQITFHAISGIHSPILACYGSMVQAGFPSPASDFLEDDIDLNQLLIPRPNSTYLVRVTGNSMVNAHIPEGALLVVDRSVKPANNRIVVAVINNEFTVKRFIKNSSGIRLLPESPNPKYKPIPITEGMEFSIWGTVTNIIINASTL